jgi:hypothetical protein
LTLRDVAGRAVRSLPVSHPTVARPQQVDVSDLPSGVYFISPYRDDAPTAESCRAVRIVIQR